MNRKELGYAVAGMLGAAAGVGCASPERSNALPTISQEVTPLGAGPELSIKHLVLAVPYASTFYKNDTHKVLSSNDKICRVSDGGHYVLLTAAGKGACTITVEDPAAGAKTQFEVSCI